MNKQIEALKMAVEAVEGQAFGKYRQEAVAKLKEALAEAEKQEIGEAEIRQMLKDIEYYQKRVEELEQPAQSACEECMGFNKQLADENDSLKSRIAELQRYAEAIVNRPTNPATWQSLSDDNILKLFKPKFECEIEDFELIDFARAIEQSLKELNAKK